jgi:hypothetical protein
MPDSEVLEIAEKIGVADNPHEVMVIQKTLELVRENDPQIGIAESVETIEYFIWDFIRFVKAAAIGGMGLTVVYFLLKIYKIF